MPALIAALLPMLGGILDRIIPDPEARAKAMADLYTQLQASDIAQIAVNKTEGAHPDIFVSGWRPAVGWVCALALAFQFLVKPLGVWLFSIFKPEYATLLLNAPGLDDMLWELMFGLLGMSAFRSLEKLKGVGSKG